MRVLVTRSAEAAPGTAAALRALGHEALVAPLTRSVALPWTLSAEKPVDAILLTSPVAAVCLAAAGAPFADRPVLAVGDATAGAARDAGYANVVSAEGTAAELEQLVARSMPDGAHLLYVAAQEVSRDLGATLGHLGFRITTVAAYRSEPVDQLDPAAEAALREGRIDAVLHFSALAARSLFHLCAAAGLPAGLPACRHLCLSRRIAAEVELAGGVALVSEKPNQSALLRLLQDGADLPKGQAARH